MNTVPVDRQLIQYLIAYLKADHSQETPEFYEKTWRVGLSTAIPELEQALLWQPSEPGYKQIASNPYRTEAGQGPILNTGSEFV